MAFERWRPGPIGVFLYVSLWHAESSLCAAQSSPHPTDEPQCLATDSHGDCATPDAPDEDGYPAPGEVEEGVSSDAESLLGQTWLDPWAWGWDPEWQTSWFHVTPRLSLSVVAGRRSGSNRIWTAPSLLTRNLAEHYAYATLAIPLGTLHARRGDTSLETHLESAATASLVGPGRGARVVSGLAVADPSTVPDRSPDEEPLPAPETTLEMPRALAADVGTTHVQEPPPGEPTPLRQAQMLRLLREVTLETGRRFEREFQTARLGRLTRRSRVSGLLPEVRLRGVWGADRTISAEEATGIYDGDTTRRGGQDTLVEGRLTFHLERLVLGASEVSLERQRQQLARERRGFIEDAVDAVARWFHLARRLARSEEPLEARIDAAEELSLALARAHLLTLGWFEGHRTLKQLGIALHPALESEQERLYERRTGEAPPK